MSKRPNFKSNTFDVQLWFGGSKRWEGKLDADILLPDSTALLLKAPGRACELRFPQRTVKVYGILPTQVAPLTPTGLQAVEATAHHIDVICDNVSDATAYTFYLDGVPQAPVSIPSTRILVQPSSVHPASYSIQVQASNIAGSSTLSAAILVPSVANTAPDWSLTDQFLFKTQAYSLDLSAVSGDNDGHPGTFSIVSGSVAGLTLVGSVFGGTPTGVGVFPMTFRRSDGFTSTDVTVNFTVADPDVTAPTPPVIDATVAGSGVTIALVTPSTDASGINRYRLFRDGVFRADVSTFPYLDGGLPDGTYDYHLTAVDNSANLNESVASNHEIVVVAVIPPTPDVPINPNVDVVSATLVTFTWQKGTQGVTPTDYDILLGDGDGAGNPVGGGSVIATIPHNPALQTQTFDVTDAHGLIPEHEHYLRVRADNGASPPSVYTTRTFFTTPPLSGPTGTYSFRAKFDTLAQGRCIEVMPGGYIYDAAHPGQDSGTNPEGWLQQHCDQLGDENNAADRGNYPWAANVVTAGQIACPGWKKTTGQITNQFPAPCPTPYRGTKCLRLEQRFGENPLAATGPRVQFRRNSPILYATEMWIGWADWWPSHVGDNGTDPWPVGAGSPDHIFAQMFESPANGPIFKITNAPSATFGIRVRADDANGNTINAGGLNQNILLASNTWHTFVLRFLRRIAGQQSIIQLWIDKTSSAQAKSIDLVTTVGIGTNVENQSAVAWICAQYNGGAPIDFPTYRFSDQHSIAKLADINGDPFTFVHPATST